MTLSTTVQREAPGDGIRGIVIGAGGEVEMRADLPAPGQPPAGHLLVRVLGAGICGTDLALTSSAPPAPVGPWSFGHEAVGTVCALGPDTGGNWRVGQMVVLESNMPDLSCSFCLAGHTSRCRHMRSAGVLTQPGFMNDLVIHPAEFTHRAPAGTEVEDLVCVEPLAVAVAAARRSGIELGQSVLVLGAGTQGLFMVQVLRAMGFRPFLTDLHEEWVAFGLRYGAAALPSGDWHVDHVFDAAGSPEALGGIVDHLAPGAIVTIVGESNEPFEITGVQMVQRQITLFGSFIYDHPRDFVTALDLIGRGEVDTRGLLRSPVTMGEAPQLLTVASSEPGKPWIDLRL